VPIYEGIAGNETADQLAKTESEHPFMEPEPACDISVGLAKKAVRNWTNRNHKKILGIINWTRRDKRTFTRTLCQENKGGAKIKQKPATLGGRTTYRTLSLKRTPFQTGIDR
jgi:hypothetical protein